MAYFDCYTMNCTKYYNFIISSFFDNPTGWVTMGKVVVLTELQKIYTITLIILTYSII